MALPNLLTEAWARKGLIALVVLLAIQAITHVVVCLSNVALLVIMLLFLCVALGVLVYLYTQLTTLPEIVLPPPQSREDIEDRRPFILAQIGRKLRVQADQIYQQFTNALTRRRLVDTEPL
jgi:hypothetical protein